MKKVLVFQGRINDIVAVGATFPVSPEMVWIDAPDDVTHTTHEFNGTEIVLKQPTPLAITKAAFILQVKAEAGQLTTQVLSGLGSEYELAEKEATSFKAAGYPATPIPSSIEDEIASKAAKGVTITATVATDTILAAATGWRNAQKALRRNRLTVVSAAEVAVDGAALDAIKAGRATFMAALKTQLGV